MPMHTEVPGIVIDVVRAEASRFRRPLLLVHGLWTGGWIWRDLASYLAHRGWDAWIPSLLSAATPPDLESRRRALLAVWRELPAPPVVITHDAGLAVADALGAGASPAAVVAIAPIDFAGSRALHHPRFWGARFGARSVAPPREGKAAALVSGLSGAATASLRADSGAFFRTLGRGHRACGSAGGAGLMVVSGRDPAVAPVYCERLASERGWDIEHHGFPGHFPMLGGSAVPLADRVHRWLVQSLGSDLLAWVDVEDE